MRNPSAEAAKQIRADHALRADLFGPQQQLLEAPINGDVGAVPSMPVRKHTNLVHSKSKMSCLQRQVFNALLYHAHYELRDSTVLIHEISIQDLATLIGFESNNKEHLKQSLRGLVTCRLEFNILDEKGAEVWEAMTALAGVQFRNGKCFYQFAEFLRPKLYHPERYGLLYLDDMRRLTMTASTALYENATRFARWGVTPYFTIPQLRALLGADAKTYDDFRRFNSKVLSPAVKQINDVTSFDVAAEFSYERRKAEKVRFKVKPKKKRDGLLGETEAEATAQGQGRAADLVMGGDQDLVVKRLQDEMLLSEEQALAVIAEHGAKHAADAAVYVATQYSKGSVRSIAPYYLSVVSNYTTNKTSSLADTPTRPVDGHDDGRPDKTVSEFKQYWASLLEGALRRLNDEEEESLLEDFQVHIQNDPIATQAYRANGLNSQMVQALYRLFAASRLLPDKQISFDEWLKRIEPAK